MAVYYRTRKTPNAYAIDIEISLGRGRQHRFATGLKLNDKNNLNKNKVRNVQTEQNTKQKNKHLKELLHHVETQIELHETDGTYVTKEICRETVKGFSIVSPKAKSETQSFDIINHLTDVIELIATGYILTEKNAKYKQNGIKKFITLRNHLESFEKSRKQKIKLHTIDSKMFTELRIYLQGKGLIASTINKAQNNFKTFISKYLKEHLDLTVRNYDKEKVKRIAPDGRGQLKTYLDLDEINKLFYLDLSEREPQYAVVRDMWVFIALTCGIRVEDYLELDKEYNLNNIKDSEGNDILCLTFEQSKTGGEVVAPIGDKGKSILEKYNGLPKVNAATSRKLIKKICKWAGIDSKVYGKKIEGQERVVKKKFECVGNHTARLSFCTNSYNAGESEHDIMKISGHKDRKTFFQYIGTTEKQNAVKFAGGKYFKLINSIDNKVKTLHAV